MAFQKCVSNNTKQKTLWLVKENLGAHSIVRKQSDKGITVESTTLDECIEKMQLSKVDFLKIDTEGSEPEVIEGGLKSLMERKVRNVFLEWNPEVWLTRKELFNDFTRNFDIYKFVNSPFLIKRISKGNLPQSYSINLYLRLKTANQIFPVEI